VYLDDTNIMSVVKADPKGRRTAFFSLLRAHTVNPRTLVEFKIHLHKSNGEGFERREMTAPHAHRNALRTQLMAPRAHHNALRSWMVLADPFLCFILSYSYSLVQC
jgi:hypothetical protein